MVGTDNFLHVGVVFFQASIAAVTSDGANRPATHPQIGVGKLDKGFAG